MNQCQAITKSTNSQCLRNARTDSKFCWQHQPFSTLWDALDLETELLSYSYLSLDEMLSLFLDQPKIRDQLIRRYYKDKIPTLNDAINKGDINIIKYLILKGEIPNKENLQYILEISNPDLLDLLDLLEWLYQYGIKFPAPVIKYAVYSGYLEEFKFFVDKGLTKVEQNDLQLVLDAFYLRGNDQETFAYYKPILQYIVYSRVLPDKFDLNEALAKTDVLDLIKFLVENGAPIPKDIETKFPYRKDEIYFYLVQIKNKI